MTHFLALGVGGGVIGIFIGLVSMKLGVPPPVAMIAAGLTGLIWGMVCPW